MKARTSAPIGSPYDFNSKFKGQCTWYAYYRAYEITGYYPCYNNRATKTNGYSNAKKWYKNYKEPYYPIPVDKGYIPVVGDIIVFNGNYGHVAVIETDEGEGEYLVSQYNSNYSEEFSIEHWYTDGRLNGTGDPIGYLHFGKVDTQEQDNSKNQIYVSTNLQNIRYEADINSLVVGCSDIGYYNVVKTITTENYTWYQIGFNEFIAGVKNRVLFIPKTTETDYKKKYSELKKKIKEILNDY
jgi:surface antigen